MYTRALTELPTHTYEQTHFLNLCTQARFRRHPRDPHMTPYIHTGPWYAGLILSSRTPGHCFHPALPTWASSPRPLYPVSKLLPTHLLATCSAQGWGRSGLALLFAKAAGLWPLAHSGRECRNMPFLNRRYKREEVRAAGLLPPLSFLLQSLLCPSSP